MSLSYEGIGASLQLVDDYVTIMNVSRRLRGGLTDIKVGDRITAVGQASPARSPTSSAGASTTSCNDTRAGKHLRAAADTAAAASPGSQEAHLALKRAKITLESQAAKKEVHTLHRGDKELKVGVIEVPSFYQDFQARMKATPTTAARLATCTA